MKVTKKWSSPIKLAEDEVFLKTDDFFDKGCKVFFVDRRGKWIKKFSTRHLENFEETKVSNIRNLQNYLENEKEKENYL